MALGREMNDCLKIVPPEQRVDQFGVTDIALHKLESFVVGERIKIGSISRVGQHIKHDDAVMRPQMSPMYHKIGADKAGAASD